MLNCEHYINSCTEKPPLLHLYQEDVNLTCLPYTWDWIGGNLDLKSWQTQW